MTLPKQKFRAAFFFSFLALFSFFNVSYSAAAAAAAAQQDGYTVDSL